MSQANLKTFFFPYTPAMINSLENWLTQKASIGWKLEEEHGWKFVFRKCQPYETVYFAYSGFGTSLGISSDYFRTKKLYALSKTILNKSNGRIYEVDINKIDSQFRYFVLLRNKYYLKHYILMLLFSILYTIVPMFLLLANPIFIVPLIFGIIPIVYSFFSTVILIKEVRSNENKTGDGSKPLKK